MRNNIQGVKRLSPKGLDLGLMALAAFVDQPGPLEQEAGGGAVNLVPGVDHGVAEFEFAFGVREQLVDQLGVPRSGLLVVAGPDDPAFTEVDPRLLLAGLQD